MSKFAHHAEQTRTEPCGCVVAEKPGHKFTKLCAGHLAATFAERGPTHVPVIAKQKDAPNLDLVGG